MKTTNSHPKHMQTRCTRAAALLSIRKQTKVQINRVFLSYHLSPPVFNLKQADKEINIRPKHPPPQAIRISKVNKKWYCQE